MCIVIINSKRFKYFHYVYFILNLFLIGSGGKTGKLVVEYLTTAGYTVRPTVREVTADTKKALFSSLPQSFIDGPISADVTNIASLTAALQGASAVVFAASASRKGGSAQQVDFVGLENVAKVCVDLKIPRLVAISRLEYTYYFFVWCVYMCAWCGCICTCMYVYI